MLQKAIIIFLTMERSNSVKLTVNFHPLIINMVETWYDVN